MYFECLGLHVGSVIIFCMKNSINYAQDGRVMEDEDDGDHRQIVSGNPAMQIDSIVDGLIGCMLFIYRY